MRSERDEAIDMVRRSAEGVMDRHDVSRPRALRYTRPGFDRQKWASMCDLGWPALRLPEEKGGVGLGMGACCALAEEAGAALVPEPIIGALLSAALLEGDALASHRAGTSLVLPAWQSSRDADGPSEDMRLEGDALFGTKRFVSMAAGADAFLVIEPNAAWLLSADAHGVMLDIADTQDGGNVGTLTLNGAVGERLAVETAAAFAEAALATSAYLLGVAEASFARTLDYLNVRVQFGKVIGSFQALQHRAVDLKLQIELTRASVEDAAARWDRAPETRGARAAIARAKVRATSAAMLVTRHAIQMHGGIGFTDEHDIGLFLRKAMVVAPQFGSARLHKQRFMALDEQISGAAA